MIVHFSGTGNSRFCARELAERLHEPLFDAYDAIRQGAAPTLHSDTPWVFVSPTYGWRLPRIFAEFLGRVSLTGSREAYFLLTCGSEMGNAHKYHLRLCRELDLICRGSIQVIMPENYIALFDAPEEPEARKIIRDALPTLDRAAGYIQAGLPFPVPRATPLDRLKSAVVNPLFYCLIIKAGPFTVSEACIHCGKCAQVCVTNNIRLVSGRPVWGQRCTHCMACICGCPVGAIEYGRASIGKPRYQCPGL